MFDRALHTPLRIKHKNRNKHCVKGMQIRSFSDPYFPAFGLKLLQKRSQIILVLNK